MRIKLSYIVTAVLILSTTIFAFRAGEKGISVSDMKRSTTDRKLFKSFPLFNPSASEEGSITTQDNREDAVKEKKKKEKKKSKKKSKSKKKFPVSKKSAVQSRKHVTKSDSDVNSKSPYKRRRVGRSIETTFSYLTTVNANGSADPRANTGRKATLPQFSTVYIPVYSGANLTTEAQNQFNSQLSSAGGHRDKLFVLNEATPSDDDRTQYKILVYSQNGLQYVGSFESEASNTFPFKGKPSIESVDPSTYKEITRYLVLVESRNILASVLDDEAHLQSILKTAYRSDIKNQPSIGRDPNSNMEVYPVFPGIYVTLAE